MAEVQSTESLAERRPERRNVRAGGVGIVLALAVAMCACRSPARDGQALPVAGDGAGGAAAVSASGGALGTNGPAPRGGG